MAVYDLNGVLLAAYVSVTNMNMNHQQKKSDLTKNVKY